LCVGVRSARRYECIYIGVVRVTRYKKVIRVIRPTELYELYRYSGSTYRPKKEVGTNGD